MSSRSPASCSIHRAAASCFCGAVGAADLRVGDVSGERVGELELGLALDRRLRRTRCSELLSLQAVQELVGLPGAALGQACRPRRSMPSCRPPTASWMSAFSSAVSVSRRAAMMPWIDSGRPLDLAGQRPPTGAAHEQATVLQHPHVLLRVERIALRPLEQRLLHLGGQQAWSSSPPTSRAVSSPDSGVSEIVLRVRLATAQSLRRSSSSGRAVQTISSGTAPARSASRSMKSKQRVVCPVDVLEHQHGRAVLGQRLEEPPPRRERLHPAASPPTEARASSPTSGRRCRATHSRSRSSTITRRDRLGELLRRATCAGRIPGSPPGP